MRGAGVAAILFFSVLALDVVVAAWFFLRQALRRTRSARRRAAELAMRIIGAASAVPPRDERFARRHRLLFLEECARITDTVRLTDAQRASLSVFLAAHRTDVALIRELHSGDRLVRARAAARLPLVPTRAARVALIDSLERERSLSVKLFMAAALTDLGEAFAIPSIIDTLAGEPRRYQRSLWGLLSEFGEDLAALLPVLTMRGEKEIQLLLIHFAGRHRSPQLYEYLLSRLGVDDPDIPHEAFRVLCAAYPGSIDHAHFLEDDDPLIRSLAAESLGGVPTARSLGILFEHLDDAPIRRSVVLAFTAILRARPEHFQNVMKWCLDEPRPAAHEALVEVLAGYVDYLMEKLLSSDASTITQVLSEIVRHGWAQEVVNFLNRNSNEMIERSACVILRGLAVESAPLARQLSLYLDGRIVAALGLQPQASPVQAPARREHPKLLLLYIFLALGAAFVPAVCLVLALTAAHAPVGALSWAHAGLLLNAFLRSFTAAFTVYATVLNVVYLLLLLFSAIGVFRQAAQSDLLRLSFLFKENVLPSISLITPAFNEEASIVESVSSLLNLRYPDYEVIVVNDGSKDRTLERLVSHFGLERTDLFVHRFLNTQEIRGLYANKRYPELLVIDKANGGKADSLNAGINVARKEYFAGMDADSMLERDALLNLAGLFLFCDEEVVAAGGNILPVNGCTVRRGALVSTRVPRKPVALFQTIEYLRAFMAGRVGWAAIKTLLIISGAFGVFNRARVVAAHGYLTRSEHYMKDTVGEDMELVVRLTRGLKESGTPYAVQYAHHANCWTEIPERLKMLNRQRDRWQRGLLDIVTFHSKMLFNPRYGRTGLIGFPYFLLFEILGPWFEAEGYIVLIVSLALGSIGLPLFLLMFTSTVLLGVLVSTASMIIAEHRREYFPLRDKLLLVWYAVLENFGFRQLMSLLRVRGFLRMLARVGGWGAMERKGLGSGAVQPPRPTQPSAPTQTAPTQTAPTQPEPARAGPPATSAPA